MQTFKELKYERYTAESLREAVEPQIAAIERAENFDEVLKARELANEAFGHFDTMSALAYARYSLDTRNAFYLKEQEYYDENSPYAQELAMRLGKALISGKFKADAEKLSPALVKSTENRVKATAAEIIPDRQREAAETTKYSRLMSTMQFEFEGKKLPLSVVRGELNDPDRSMRRKAAEAIGRGLEAHRDELDGIFDNLVKIRDGMAKKLGYENYVTLGYYNMDRKDYDRGDVENFRGGVRKYIVPLVTEMKSALSSELHIDKFMFYDNGVTMKDEPKPILSPKQMFAAAAEMYDDMDPEIGDFMRFMQEAESFDVTARDGKCGGGYCTEFYDYRRPFILANWNGTCDDVDVLTHEFGHAFAAKHAMEHGIFELGVGGMETAECHSMTMELMSHPYMDKFFGHDGDKYRYRHLFKNIDFLPYGSIVDEFQHIIYSEPNLTPKERNGVFKELTAKYMPYMSYDGIPYLEEGTRWQYQSHIYEMPFYYIDYCLAQTVAFEFFALGLKMGHKSALKAYTEFVKKGGSKMFKTLVSEAGLPSPFDPEALKDVANAVLAEMKEIKSRIG